MTRTEAITRINERLAEADDETVEALAEIVEHYGAESELPRPLTPRELALIEQAKADFREGRSYSIKEAERYLDAALDDRRRQRS